MSIRHTAFALVGLLAFATIGLAQDAPDAKSNEPSQEELEQQLAETLSGATLVGQFTVSGVNDGKPLAPDRYELGTVKKLKNGLWSIEARIQYGGKDVKLPLALPIKWAGDTPVICVTKIFFPGLGTYSARVLIYDDQYVGTWGGADHGGQMFGQIVKGDAAKPAEPPEAK
jgi:hypothetical protein